MGWASVLLATTLLAGAPACAVHAGMVRTGATAGATFSNPVISCDWPDPTIVDGGDGSFYSVATGLRTVYSSTNLIDWVDTKIDPVAPEARRTLHRITRNLWAPSLVRIGDEWLLYISLFVSDPDCRIAVLSARSPKGPFIYRGEVINALKLGILNLIDPYVLEVEGRVWMFCGSCQDGIHCVELTRDGLAIKPGAKLQHVAGLRFDPKKKMWGAPGCWEGVYLLQRHGWWYLFASGGFYNDESYHMTVGRSRALTGPYLDRDGHPLTAGLARPILKTAKGGRFYGPGHNGDIFTSADGRDWIFFHAHDRTLPKSARPTLLQELKWTPDNWPYLEGDCPQPVERAFRVAR